MEFRSVVLDANVCEFVQYYELCQMQGKPHQMQIQPYVVPIGATSPASGHFPDRNGTAGQTVYQGQSRQTVWQLPEGLSSKNPDQGGTEGFAENHSLVGRVSQVGFDPVVGGSSIEFLAPEEHFREI
jgi:hypothetical protein